MNMIRNLFGAMEARRKTENRFFVGIFAIACLGLTVLGLCIVIVSSILNAVETSSVNQIYGETYARSCEPVPTGRETIDNMPELEPAHKLLILISDSQRRHSWHAELPRQWRADTVEEVVLIACIEEELLLLETCEYLRDSARSEDAYTVRIRRQQYQTRLIILNAHTAQRIDSRTVTGSEPPECPEDDGRIGSGERRGEPVEWADFAPWVERYVFEN